MRAMISAAVVAVGLMGCGPDLNEAPPVGAAAQAIEQKEPVVSVPERLRNEQLFGPTIQLDPSRTFQDHFAYTVKALGPNH